MFRAGRDELVALDNRHLAFGLVCTWLVGIGRWWDDPGANLLQHLGLGSIIYVFVLTAFLWLFIRPLGPKDFGYLRFLTFVTLTAPPAILYALPVERWMDLESARIVNAWFLGFVALWRVALLFVYLRRVSQLKWFRLTIAMLLPLCGIVTALTLLNGITGGVQEDGAGTSNDLANEILFRMAFFSVMALPVILGAYYITVFRDVRRQIRALETKDPPQS